MKGKIIHWRDDKGFGFIVSEDGNEKLFFHISTVKTQGRRPQVGDVVLYESMRDSQGRPKAKAVVIEGVVSAQKTSSNKRIRTEPPKKNALDYVSIFLVVLSLLGAVYSFIQTGSIEKAIPLGVILIMAVVLLNRQKKPKEKKFSCARCRKVSEHDKRGGNGVRHDFRRPNQSKAHKAEGRINRWVMPNISKFTCISVRNASTCKNR